jgi:hypothetical protein
MQRVQLWPKGRNPLWFAFWGSVIALPFWLVYLSESHGFGVVVIVAESIFLVLYLRHSYFAWHLAFVMNIAFAIYHMVAGRHPTLDITIGTSLIIYLLIVRQPYVDYIRAYADQRI